MSSMPVTPLPNPPVSPPNTLPTASTPQPPIVISTKATWYYGPDRPIDFLYFSAHSKLIPEQNRYDKSYKVYTNTDILRHDQNVKIYQEITYASKDGQPVNAGGNELVIETGDSADKVLIKKGPDRSLIAIINRKSYQLNLVPQYENEPLSLRIRTKGGDDHVLVATDVENDICIELGDGNDLAQAGAGRTRIYGGEGNDLLKLGSGNGIAFGGNGNDTLIAGFGNGILKGGNGNDRLQAGKGLPGRRLFMDGGDDHDFMISTRGNSKNPTIIHGGKGDNLIVAHGPATIYTGRDRNIVRSDSDDTVIYAKPTDEVHRTSGSTLVHSIPDESGKSGYIVEGSPEFKQNLEEDMELLRMSPQGRVMLGTADTTARRNDSPVHIVEHMDDGAAYQFSNTTVREHLAAGKSADTLVPEAWGNIAHNQRGAVATGAEILYNPSFVPEQATIPVNILYHEMAHAYNGATGTKLQGSTEGEPNSERQAVGLPTNAQPFDFDNHRATPPTAANPKPFTENALLEEMRLPLRTKYYDKIRPETDQAG
ncbi:M91 family zinc metallopeptidase [Pseudomonas sp. 32A]|uniref:M91 family zinc metallopeptidase n=1 Tax=Pseudomonas sp. 32A TaxID=651185 RepID=UPI004045650E